MAEDPDIHANYVTELNICRAIHCSLEGPAPATVSFCMSVETHLVCLNRVRIGPYHLAATFEV